MGLTNIGLDYILNSLSYINEDIAQINVSENYINANKLKQLKKEIKKSKNIDIII